MRLLPNEYPNVLTSSSARSVVLPLQHGVSQQERLEAEAGKEDPNRSLLWLLPGVPELGGCLSLKHPACSVSELCIGLGGFASFNMG